MMNHKESLAMGTGYCSVAAHRDYCSPSAEIIDICSEGVLCASIPDLSNEDWN